MYQHFVGVQLS